MQRVRIALAGAVITTLAIVLISLVARHHAAARADVSPAPVLSVAVTQVRVSMLPVRIPATGNIAAWQEASLGAESDGLRLTDVRVNVGDRVSRGEVLATFNPDIIEVELAGALAAVAHAEAEALEAQDNYRRAKELSASGAISAQQVSQLAAGVLTTKANLDAARADEQRHRLRLGQTRVLAPSDGVITSRSATVGAVIPAGQELFRLIKDGRLEWRAAVSVADLDKLRPGQAATISVRGHEPLQGHLRMVAPDINAQTHSGLVYVDLPPDAAVRAGEFVTGHIEVGNRPTLTLPQGAVLLRDGFHYAMRVGAKSDVIAVKVAVGRRVDDRIEIAAGLAAGDVVIASGLSFLSEGDTVKVVDEFTSDNANATDRSRSKVETRASGDS